MLRRSSLALVLLVTAIGAGAKEPAARTASFNVGGVGYAMTLQPGFCLPTGPLVAVAQTVAAADSTNVTNLTVYRCDAAPQKLGDYMLIKTPATLIGTTVDKALFAAQVVPQFDKPMPVSDDQLAATAADGYDRVTGTRPKLGMKLATHGHDDLCGYMSASGTVGTGDVSRNIAMGSCTAAIGGRLIQVIRYTELKSPADEQRMMREARAAALTIRPVVP